MYNLELKEDEKDEHPENYTLKPMNCPGVNHSLPL